VHPVIKKNWNPSFWGDGKGGFLHRNFYLLPFATFASGA
jgi:hypothetical protein